MRLGSFSLVAVEASVHKIISGHFYRAACNADAVLWWEFCLSVRLSHACIVTKR